MFLQLDDQKKIDQFYSKMTKLVDYFPFVRQQQLNFGIDPRVDKEFVGVQHDLRNIVEKTMMAE